jgi:hypothetical protein
LRTRCLRSAFSLLAASRTASAETSSRTEARVSASRRFTSAYRRSACCSAARCSCIRSFSFASSSCSLRRLEVANNNGSKPFCAGGEGGRGGEGDKKMGR